VPMQSLTEMRTISFCCALTKDPKCTHWGLQ